MERKSRIRKLLVSMDQFFAVLIYDSYEDETLSSYIGRKKMGKWPQRVIDWVFYTLTGERDHCLNNIEKQFLG